MAASVLCAATVIVQPAGASSEGAAPIPSASGSTTTASTTATSLTPASNTPASNPPASNTPASLTSVDDTDPAITYSGQWQTGTGNAKFGGSDHYTDQQGASASLTFTGSSITLFGAMAPWHGDLAISVDGGNPVVVSAYAADRVDDAQVYLRTGLPEGRHLITVTATGTGDHGHVFAIDRFQVGSAQPAPATTSVGAAASEPAGTTPLIVDDAQAAFTYSGPWANSQGPARSAGEDHYTSSSGATATLTFDGTGATILGATAPWYGVAWFSVDGGPERVVDLYAADRRDQQSLFSVHDLTTGSHTIRATVTGHQDATSTGSVVSIDGATVTGTADTTSTGAPADPTPNTPPPNTPSAQPPTTATLPPTTPSPSTIAPSTTATAAPSTTATTPPPAVAPAIAPAIAPPPARNVASSEFVTRKGSRLQLGGSTFRFAGANEYWLGLDDNLRDAAGQPTHPTDFRIDSGLNSAVAAGLTVVRSQSMGISVGCAACVEPSLGVFDDAAFASADYALYRAGQLGLKMIIPLTDQWRYYHGGISTFTSWRGYPNDPNTSVTAGSSHTERDVELNFYTDPKVVGDFQTYIAHLLDHVNPYTGLAWKDDPTVLAWETGNELWTANPTWTEQIASFIKNWVGARQLVADGSGADGMHVADAAIDAPDVDMVSGHFYPVDTGWMATDAAVAAAHQKVYFVGEFAWTDLAASARLLAAAQADPQVSGDLVWSILPYQEDATPEPHGDGYALYSPGTTDPMRQFLDLLSAHAKAMNRG